MVSRVGIPALLCSFALTILAASAPAQELILEGQDLVGGVPRRLVDAVRLVDGERIALDGRLDEGVWQRAGPGDCKGAR